MNKYNILPTKRTPQSRTQYTISVQRPGNDYCEPYYLADTEGNENIVFITPYVDTARMMIYLLEYNERHRL